MAEGKIYWTDTISGNFGRVLRSNLDGTNIETIVSRHRRTFRGGLALDVAEGKIYWRTDNFYDSEIMRSNLDGTNTEDLGIRRKGYDLALDVAGDKMYWAEGHIVRRSNLDGTNIETILTIGNGSIWAIALGPYYEQTNPSEGEEIPVRSRGEARSEVAERGISYSSSSFVTYAQNGDLDVVRLLIEAGLDVNARDENDSGDTALMKAAEQGHLDVVRFLVEQGANLRLFNVLRQNALYGASGHGALFGRARCPAQSRS